MITTGTALSFALLLALATLVLGIVGMAGGFDE